MAPEIKVIAAIDLAGEAKLTRTLLSLNNAHEVELSFLTADRLRRLAEEAFVAARIGAVEAFLIAFDQDAEYDSPNFLWFRSRLARFVYVDRVVVAVGARGRGPAEQRVDPGQSHPALEGNASGARTVAIRKRQPPGARR